MFDLIRLFFWTALIWFLLAVALTGFSCVRHGDVGPYPEVEWIPSLVIPAFWVSWRLCTRK